MLTLVETDGWSTYWKSRALRLHGNSVAAILDVG
jgi:hypothetical protein